MKSCFERMAKVALNHTGVFALDLTDGNIHPAWISSDQVCLYRGVFGGLCFYLPLFNRHNGFQDPIRQSRPEGENNPPNTPRPLMCNISQVQIWWLCQEVKYTPNTPYPPQYRLWFIVNTENTVKSRGNRCPGTDTSESQTVFTSVLAHLAREHARGQSTLLLSPARPRVECVISERKEV